MATPAGPERQVRFIGGAAIDGAPLAYIVVLSAVVAVLAFVPFSVVLSSGGSFPLSQCIYPLVGWILGPLAGAIACCIGALVGMFLAPHTAGVYVVRLWGALVAGFAAGSMSANSKRKYWWILLTGLFVLEFLLYAGRAVLQNGVSIYVVGAGSVIDWSGILLFALPTRVLVAKWISSKNLAWTAAGLFLGTWMIAGVWHISATVIQYYLQSWPENVWIALIPVAPVENLMRSLVGVVIGTSVIAGLRAIGLVKPTQAVY